ncbi:MAG: NAD-dependent epimerase/dehydratase family protein [Acidimicrobiales bacterium]
MRAIAVTGAAGALGRRTLRQLAAHPDIDRIVAIDRVAQASPVAKVEYLRLDLRRQPIDRAITGCSTIVHLAEEAGQPNDSTATMTMLATVLDGATAAGVPHVVALSSAMAYGAHPDNPIPLTEAQPLRPVPELAYAVAKRDLEESVWAWAEADTSRRATVLRPTTTLSEQGVAWAARVLRSATIVRPDQVDPPLQFLHYDDLASAIAYVARRELAGAYNVAPDGWIGPDVFRDLVGGVQLRVPERVNDNWLAATRKLGLRSSPPGIEAYVRYPWVVSNDRLRTAGWVPTFSNSEAFVIGTPPPPWSVTAQQRQELALAAAGIGLAGVAAVAAGVARRLLR